MFREFCVGIFSFILVTGILVGVTGYVWSSTHPTTRVEPDGEVIYLKGDGTHEYWFVYVGVSVFLGLLAGASAAFWCRTDPNRRADDSVP
jgi:hypothetical protein